MCTAENERFKKQYTFEEEWCYQFEWLESVPDVHHASCKICRCVFKIGHNGWHAVIAHAKTQKHQKQMMESSLMKERSTNLTDMKKSAVPVSEYRQFSQCSSKTSYPLVAAASEAIAQISKPCLNFGHKGFNHFKSQSSQPPYNNYNENVLKEISGMENIYDECMSEDHLPVTDITSTAEEATFHQPKENLSHKNPLAKNNYTENELNLQISIVCSLNSEAVMNSENVSEEDMLEDNSQNCLRETNPSIYNNFQTFNNYISNNEALNAKKPTEDNSNKENKVLSNQGKFQETPKKGGKSHANPEIAFKEVTSEEEKEKVNQDIATKKRKSENKIHSQASSVDVLTPDCNEDKLKNSKIKSHANSEITFKKVTSEGKKLKHDIPMKRNKSEKKEHRQVSSAEELTSHCNEGKFDNRKIKSHSNIDITFQKVTEEEKEKLSQDKAMKRKNSEKEKRSQASSAKTLTLHYNEDNTKIKSRANLDITHKKIASFPAEQNLSNSPTEKNKYAPAYPSTSKQLTDQEMELYEFRKLCQTTKITDNKSSEEHELSKQNTVTNQLPVNKAYLEHLQNIDNCLLASTQSKKDALLLKKKHNLEKNQKLFTPKKSIQKIKKSKNILANAVGPKSQQSKNSRDKWISVQTEENCFPSCSREPDHNLISGSINPDVNEIKKSCQSLLEKKKSFDKYTLNALLEIKRFVGEYDTSKFDFIDSVYDRHLSNDFGCNKDFLKFIFALFYDSPDSFNSNPSCNAEHNIDGSSSSVNSHHSPAKLIKRKNEAQVNLKRCNYEPTNEEISNKRKKK